MGVGLSSVPVSLMVRMSTGSDMVTGCLKTAPLGPKKRALPASSASCERRRARAVKMAARGARRERRKMDGPRSRVIRGGWCAAFRVPQPERWMRRRSHPLTIGERKDGNGRPLA